jgi:hypothetical protein
MTSINDFNQLEWLLAQSGETSPSAEDEYFALIDDEPETPHLPLTTTVTRTTVHHYRHATITKTERIITNRRQNTTVHVYHSTTKENQS